MFRVTYKGVAYVFRLIEEIAKGANRVSMAANANNTRLASVMAAMNQQDYSTRSAIEMERMLQQGKGFCQFDIMEKDYQTFMDAAKEAGVRYSCVTMDKINEPGNRLFTIFCSPDQADIVNRIIEINELSAVHSTIPSAQHGLGGRRKRQQPGGANFLRFGAARPGAYRPQALPGIPLRRDQDLAEHTDHIAV